MVAILAWITTSTTYNIDDSRSVSSSVSRRHPFHHCWDVSIFMIYMSLNNKNTSQKMIDGADDSILVNKTTNKDHWGEGGRLCSDYGDFYFYDQYQCQAIVVWTMFIFILPVFFFSLYLPPMMTIWASRLNFIIDSPHSRPSDRNVEILYSTSQNLHEWLAHIQQCVQLLDRSCFNET